MNKLTLLLAALFASSATAESSIASEMKNLWNTWKTLHNKVYTQSEDYERFSIFSQNYLTVINYNKKNNGVKLALNQFADLSDAEFKAQYTSGLLNDEPKAQNFEPEIDYSLLALPTTVDWRKKGAVNPVKNQAKCGSCWAFAAASALESLHFQKTGKLLSFSEQQLVDCDQVSHGCNGGSSRNGFNLVAEQGIELESDYPYEAKDAECRYDASKAIRVNSGYKDVKPRNPTALKVAVAIRPVYVSVQADQPAFRFYSSGVLKEDCDTGLNHAVLAVGFTQVDGEDAFIVRNSWTENWGTEGYIHLSASGKINQGAGVCGMLIRPAYPIA